MAAAAAEHDAKSSLARRALSPLFLARPGQHEEQRLSLGLATSRPQPRGDAGQVREPAPRQMSLAADACTLRRAMESMHAAAVAQASAQASVPEVEVQQHGRLRPSMLPLSPPLPIHQKLHAEPRAAAAVAGSPRDATHSKKRPSSTMEATEPSKKSKKSAVLP